MSTALTEAEHADATVAAARRTGWILLIMATAASLAGNILHAAQRGGAAMAAAAVVPLLLLLAMHLVGGLTAARRAGRVHRGVHRAAVAGVSALAVMTLAASFMSLRDLLLSRDFDAAAAVLIPLAVDIAVVVATASLFSLAPRTRGRVAAPARRAGAPATRTDAAPDVSAGAAGAALVAPVQHPAAATPAASSVVPEVNPKHVSTAAQLLRDRVVSIGETDAAAVLAWLEASASNRRIQTETGIDARTVAKIRAAVTATDTTPVLTAVR